MRSGRRRAPRAIGSWGAGGEVAHSAVRSASTLAIVVHPAEIDHVDYVVDGPHISLAEETGRGRS
jgi:hypothetical protein